jgi:hypothetical protein
MGDQSRRKLAVHQYASSTQPSPGSEYENVLQVAVAVEYCGRPPGR